MIRQVVLYLTRRCNLRCEHCYIPNISSKELTTEELCRIIRIIHEKIKPEMIILFGGEPFVRQDIEEIIDCINSVDTHYTIITNGTLKKHNVIKKLKSLTLSIDFLPWQVSSEIRENIPVIVEKSLAGFELLNESLQFDLPEVVVSTIVTKYNVSFLPEIVKWMSERGIWTIPGIVHTVRNQNFTFRGETDLNINEEQASWIAENMIQLKKQGYLIHNINKYFELLPTYIDFSWKCTSLDYFIINANGDLLACHDWPGRNFPQINFLDSVAQNRIDFNKFQELYVEDVKECP
ncbi:MAG: radical SAM protein [Candidatus Lokiarchaeota archaeon]|nr:radical SAM protein [Candidatus Lokiarchaeota archaeon]